MTGTYRMTLMYVRDGYYDGGCDRRKSRARNKPIDRRIQRRQHARIIKRELEINAYDQMMQEKEARELDHELWLAETQIEAEWEDHYDDWISEEVDHDYFNSCDYGYDYDY